MAPDSLVYVSRATVAFNESSLHSLAESASSRNRLAAMTGFLHFSGGRFTQYLEGPEKALHGLFDSIRRDDRHEVLAVAYERKIAVRRFPDWAMRWVREEELREIALETVVADHLLLAQAIERVTNYERPLWRVIDAIAHARKRIKESRTGG